MEEKKGTDMYTYTQIKQGRDTHSHKRSPLCHRSWDRVSVYNFLPLAFAPSFYP